MDRIIDLHFGFIMSFNNLVNFNFTFKGHNFKLEDISHFFAISCSIIQDKIWIYHRHPEYPIGYKNYSITLSDLSPEDINSLINLLVEKGILLE